MLGRMTVMAFVPVSDLERASTFYGSVLDLELVTSVPGVVAVFDAGGTALRVTAVDAHVAAAWTVIGWAVPDIDATLRQLAEKGLEPDSYPGMTGDDGTWTAPGGDRIAWFRDPDGNVLSLTQFVSDGASAREIVPIFPTRDLGASIERYARLGFTTSTFDDDGVAIYGFLERNGVHVHLTPFDELDPATYHQRGVPLRRRCRRLVRRVGGGGRRGSLPSGARAPTTACVRVPTSIPTATSSASARSCDLKRLVPDPRRFRSVRPRRVRDVRSTIAVVATLRDCVNRRDEELFVGRGRELARFDMLLAGDPVRLLYVSGAGGIGKSTLLRAMGRRAADAGYAVVTLDGRDLQPFPSVLTKRSPRRWSTTAPWS